MLLRTKLHGKTYEFPDLRLLMGKANEEKSGDRLAGVAADSVAERVAARFVLAEVPLWALRENPAVPYDQDEVTRVIADAVNETVYNEMRDWTVGALREWLLADTTSSEMIARLSNGLTAEMIAAVTKLMSNLDLMYCAKKIPRLAHCANTIGTPGALSSRNQPNHPTDSPEAIRAEVYEGLSYGSGNSVIGINPVDDSYSSVARLLEMTYDVINPARSMGDLNFNNPPAVPQVLFVSVAMLGYYPGLGCPPLINRRKPPGDRGLLRCVVENRTFDLRRAPFVECLNSAELSEFSLDHDSPRIVDSVSEVSARIVGCGSQDASWREAFTLQV